MKSAKKVLVTIVLMLSVSFSVFAQNADSWYNDGYRGSDELETGSTFSRTFVVSVLSSHGYSVGNGLYFGVGAGCTVNPADNGNLSLPIFADMRYSFIDKPCSPFVDLKLGTSFYIEDVTAGLFIRPSVGVDVRNWSLHLGYGLYTGTETIAGLWPEKFTKHALMIGGSWWF